MRGLHFQAPPHAQDKLVRCGTGRIFDVAVDIRTGSPTYGKWVGVELSFENGKQLLVPKGFLHGFVTREPDTEIMYKCTDDYAPARRCGALGRSGHRDRLGADGAPILSDKDAAAPLSVADFGHPFIYEGRAMKILVTGGAGFIGSAVVRHADAGGASVVNLDALTYAACLDNVAPGRATPALQLRTCRHPRPRGAGPDLCRRMRPTR